MKCFKIYFRHILIISFFAIFIFGCPSSGGGGNDSSEAPTITNVKTYLYVDEDDETWIEQNSFFIGDLLTWKCLITDKNLDALYWYITIYKNVNGAYELYEGPNIGELEPQPTATTYYYPETPLEIDYPPGQYEAEFQIEDKKGNMSDNAKVAFTVNSNMLSTGLKIFVTRKDHTGDFLNDPFLSGANALEKADSFCNQDPNKPNDSVYKALLVDGTIRDAVTLTDWVLQPNTTYYRPYNNVEIGATTDKAILATLYQELTNEIDPICDLESIVNCMVWTGISNSGDFEAGDDCNNWSSSKSNGYLGAASMKNKWAFTDTITACDSPGIWLYCVEQP